MKQINKVTIIGANGTLGKAISAIFASFGNATVYMISRSVEKSQQAIDEAVLSVKADAIKSNMYPKDYSNLGECIDNSDLIVECIIEDYMEKRKIHEQMNKYGDKNCYYATITSGLSINELSKCYDGEKAKRFLGIHFFNPPYNLQLCEIILSDKTEMKVKEEMQEYLEDILYRKTIIVKDSPCFLANRIGFQFINKAIQYADKYQEDGGIDYIDAILGKFTGRNMPPILTADFVGLDIHKAIMDNLRENVQDYEKETFVLPSFVNDLVEEGNIGKKVNQGFYKSIDGQTFVYDIKNKSYRKICKYDMPFIANIIKEFKVGNYENGMEKLFLDNSKEAKICQEFLIDYIKYSIYVAREVGEKIEDCDIAMAEGFNWIPPLALLNLLQKSGQTVTNETVPSSKYDYRKYLKAKE